MGLQSVPAERESITLEMRGKKICCVAVDDNSGARYVMSKFMEN